MGRWISKMYHLLGSYSAISELQYACDEAKTLVCSFTFTVCRETL